MPHPVQLQKEMLMLRYIGRRLLQTIPVFFGATFLIFAMVYMTGDPLAALAGDKPMSEAARARLEAEFNLDKPLFVQYLLYLKGILTLDFGTTFSGRPVADVIAQAFPITVKLALIAIVIEAVIGVGLGFFAGIRKGRLFDSTILVLSLVLISVPVFVLGFVLQFMIGLKLKWLPPIVGSDTSFERLLLPAIVLAGMSMAYTIRLTRQSIIENTESDFVRTARAKGMKGKKVMVRHILRNSLIPVVTFLGGDLGALMAGAIVTEGIFAIRGIGGTLYQATIRGESATIVTITVVMILVYILMNLLVDLLYAVLDPRIRYV